MNKISLYKHFMVSCLMLIVSSGFIHGQTNPSGILNDTTVYLVVEQMPEFPGGQSELLRFWTKNIKYPSIEAEEIESTRIIVEFIIEKDGSATHPKIIRTIHPSINDSIIEIINKMPKWAPGKHKSLAVRVKYTLPIHVDFR